MHDGIKVNIGGAEYVVPRLSLANLKEHGGRLRELGELKGTVPPPEKIEDVCVVIHAALRRNYPDLTLEWVAANVDLGNLKTIFDTLMGMSGLVPVGGAKGEGTAPASP